MIDTVMAELSGTYHVNSYMNIRKELKQDDYMRFLVTSRAGFKSQFRKEPTLMLLNTGVLDEVLKWTMGDQAVPADPDTKYEMGNTEVRCREDIDPKFLYLAVPKSVPGVAVVASAYPGNLASPSITDLRPKSVEERTKENAEKAVARKKEGLSALRNTESILNRRLSKTEEPIMALMLRTLLAETREEIGIRESHADVHPVHRVAPGDIERVKATIHTP